MSIEPCRQSTRDDVMTFALVRAAGSLLDDLVDRLLRTDERVATAAQGKRLIAADDGMEDVTDRVQRFVAIATPALRVLARGALPVGAMLTTPPGDVKAGSHVVMAGGELKIRGN